MENDKSYVVLYNPKIAEEAKKAELAARHKCDLPRLSGNDGGEFTYRAVVECEQCAKKWYAVVWALERHDQENEWRPLKWYHMRLHFMVMIRKGK